MTTQDDAGTHATPADSGDATNSQQLPSGSNLGRYVIIQPIGSGGMGTVYRAYNPQLNRGVALKILSVKHADLQAAKRAKARLIREAQALAQLSHPNVVAVHDAGTFEDDVFIAMELVEGKTLDGYLKEEKRSVKEILDVMRAAGRGLSAAHQAGSIHRDFKPGNVIVGEDGRVRVLDFGLARAADQQESMEGKPEAPEPDLEKADERSHETDYPFDWKEISSDSSPNLLQSPLTHSGGVLGTPLYMAPEQHLGLKTDERTDIFGFCVVLYEVLYGKRPFAASSLEKLKSEVIRQQVCIPPANTNVPAWLWQIVRKGLCVKPVDRYATIDSLLEDLEKDPEEVRRHKRLARRRKVFVIALILLTISLPIGVWYGLRYRTFQLCRAAEGELDGIWDDATKVSIKEAFFGTKKSYAQGTWERVDRIFDEYTNDWLQMRSEVCEAKILRATLSEDLFDLRMSCLSRRIGEVGALLKVFAKADVEIMHKAVQASTSLAGVEICADEKALRAPYPPPRTAQAKAEVVAIREKLNEVVALSKTGKYKQGLELAKAVNRRASILDYRPVQAEVLYQLGHLLSNTGAFKTAETRFYQAARAAGESENSLIAAKAMISLVWLVGHFQARHEAGLVLARDAEVMLAVAGANEHLRANLLKNRGALYHNHAEYNKALEYFQKSLAIYENQPRPEHLSMAASLNNIGLVFYRQGDNNKALEYYRKSLAIYENVLGPDHPHVAMLLNNIGGVLSIEGELSQAREYYFRSLEIREKALGPDHPDVAQLLEGLGILFQKQGLYNKALTYGLKSLEIRRKSLELEHPDIARSLSILGSLYVDRGDTKKAFEYFSASLRIRKKSLGSDHPMLAWSLAGIGGVLIDQGRPKQALETLERAVAICAKRTCDLEPHGLVNYLLARALMTTGGNKDRARKLVKDARDVFKKSQKMFEKNLKEVNTWLQQQGVKFAENGP